MCDQDQVPLHVLASHQRQDSCEFLQAVYPRVKERLNAQDKDGNTPILLSFISQEESSFRFCGLLLRNGGHLGIPNDDDDTVFDIAPNSKKLRELTKHICAQPSFIEHSSRQVCRTKFSTMKRRHHCRHCGRTLCKKDSTLKCPIVKFQLDKPQRVCDYCHGALTGAAAT